jgi:pimeloyl-ACP methyl ester carboxylesterase
VTEVRVNGVRLYYEEHGEGETILCVHGSASSAMVWTAAAEELSRLGRVVLYDRRGCTRTVVVPGGHLVDPAASAVTEFVEEVLRG